MNVTAEAVRLAELLRKQETKINNLPAGDQYAIIDILDSTIALWSDYHALNTPVFKCHITEDGMRVWE